MSVKILMCPYYYEHFLQSGVRIIKRAAHFHCECEEKEHQMFVYFCSAHPFGSTVFNHVGSNEEVETSYFCKKKDSHELCEYCINVGYSFNFSARKVCLNDLPDCVSRRFTTLNKHLRSINYDPFFYWDKKNNRVEISLDNPNMPKIPNKTDYNIV